jgi:2,3,4,5-tetrahydropyridine-2,6-dicarboxylate N-succinyltransferase
VDLQSEIEALWQRRESLGPASAAEADVVRAAVGLLDSGQARVAELGPDGEVVVNEWLKMAVLLWFKVCAIEVTELGPFEYADRLPLKRGFK